MNRLLKVAVFPCVLVVVVAVLLLKTAGAGAASPSGCQACPGGTRPDAGAAPFKVLTGVAAVSPNDVWAVGSSFGGTPSAILTLIEHWNGERWKVVTSPNPGGVNFSALNGVAVVSARDIWAVGSFSGSSGPSQTLIEHWNGERWKVVTSPSPGGNSNELNGVAVVSARDIWAVGDFSTNGPTQTLIEHWDGQQWNVVASPSSVQSLSGEVPLSGGGPPFSLLVGVAAVSPKDVWAVGSSFSGGLIQTLIEHWDGQNWSIVASPNPGSASNSLNGVAVVEDDDVWAVGSFFSSGLSSTPALIEHWDGQQWSVVSSPSTTVTLKSS